TLLVGKPCTSSSRGAFGSPNSAWKTLSLPTPDMDSRGTHSKNPPASSHSRARPSIASRTICADSNAPHTDRHTLRPGAGPPAPGHPAEGGGRPRPRGGRGRRGGGPGRGEQ